MIYDVPKPQTGLGFDALVAQLLPDLQKVRYEDIDVSDTATVVWAIE